MFVAMIMLPVYHNQSRQYRRLFYAMETTVHVVCMRVMIEMCLFEVNRRPELHCIMRTIQIQSKMYLKHLSYRETVLQAILL